MLGMLIKVHLKKYALDLFSYGREVCGFGLEI